MAIFQRKHKDPAQEAYRQMAREKAIKKQYDFIGMTGKMDLDIDQTPKYKRAMVRFEDELKKPLEEGWSGAKWHPGSNTESIEVMNSMDPENVAKKTTYARDRVEEYRSMYIHPGRILDELHMPYAEKHKIAREMFHHDWNKGRTDPDFHQSKTSVDRVLEEMTRHRPSAENRERIRNAIDTFKQSDPRLHEYLKDKYKFATTDDEVGPFKIYKPHEQILTEDEVNKYKDTHVFSQGRVISESWQELGVSANETKKWQLHPDGTTTRVSALLPHTHRGTMLDFGVHPFQTEEDEKSINFHHKNLSDLHGDHINNSHYHDSIFRYTQNSGELNRYIARGENGISSEHHYENDSKAISESIQSSPPYAHKIQVWSGVSRSNDIGSYVAKKKDNKEKLVGHFPAFTSTSLEVKEAAGFSRNKEAQGFKHQNVRDLMRVDIPKAYHRGLYVDKASYHKSEMEYILDKGHDFEFHPKPLYYAHNGDLFRVWKARPILTDEDKATIDSRAKVARET